MHAMRFHQVVPTQFHSRNNAFARSHTPSCPDFEPFALRDMTTSSRTCARRVRASDASTSVLLLQQENSRASLFVGFESLAAGMRRRPPLRLHRSSPVEVQGNYLFHQRETWQRLGDIRGATLQGRIPDALGKK